MLDKAIIAELEALAGKTNVLTGTVDRLTYSYDATADVPRQMPDVVVLPTDTAMVQAIVRFARERRIPIYPRGAGTNLSGGTVPLKQGIVLSFRR